MAANQTWISAGSLSSIPTDRPHGAQLGGHEVVIVRKSGRVHVYQGQCPHQGAMLSEGEVEDGAIVCRNHQWRFGLADGKRQGGAGCLVACPSKVQDGQLWADVSPLEASAHALTHYGSTLDQLPGPRGLPLVGNAFQIKVPEMHQILERWAAVYGPMYRIRMGKQNFVICSDADVCNEIMRERPEKYRRTVRVEEIFRELKIHGVFSSEGEVWRPQRRLMMDALAQRNIKSFFPTLRIVTERFLGRLRSHGNKPFNIQDDLMRFTVDVTTSLTFGYDLNTLEKGDDVIQRQLEHIFPALSRRLNAIWPYWRYFQLPADRRLMKAMRNVREWLDTRLDQARQDLASNPQLREHPQHFLQSMLMGRDENGQPFSDDILRANAMTVLLAGEDTTANSLAWAVHELADRPDVVGKLRHEATQIIGDESTPASLEAVHALSYANAVANEAMRLRPVAPLVFFDTNHDVVLDTVRLPKGTTIITLTRTPATQPSNFAKPLDFLPERWLSDGVELGAHEPNSNLPFGSGPRICPGRSLALIEMRLILGTLYKHFDIERVTPRDAVREHFSFTMEPKNFLVKLTPRQPSSSTM